MTTSTSEGLRRFHELCVVPAPADALNHTWYGHMEWVTAHVPQEEILELNIRFWEELGPISQAEDDTPEGRLADTIRNACDVTWYAMNNETMAQFTVIIREKALEDTRTRLPP